MWLFARRRPPKKQPLTISISDVVFLHVNATDRISEEIHALFVPNCRLFKFHPVSRQLFALCSLFFSLSQRPIMFLLLISRNIDTFPVSFRLLYSRTNYLAVCIYMSLFLVLFRFVAFNSHRFSLSKDEYFIERPASSRVLLNDFYSPPRIQLFNVLFVRGYGTIFEREA